MSEQQETFRFDGWAIIEFMGHRKRAGKVRTAEIGGTAVFVVESPTEEDGFVAEIYAASALYALTPVSEEVVRLAARHIAPAPITRWDLPEKIRRAMDRAEREEYEQAHALETGRVGIDYSVGDGEVPVDDDGVPF